MTPTPDPYADLRACLRLYACDDNVLLDRVKVAALLAERDDLARQLAEARAALREQHRDEEEGD